MQTDRKYEATQGLIPIPNPVPIPPAQPLPGASQIPNPLPIQSPYTLPPYVPTTGTTTTTSLAVLPTQAMTAASGSISLPAPEDFWRNTATGQIALPNPEDYWRVSTTTNRINI
ncbi:hypothetical protein FJZ33_01105, partial [Candidatus Poribacteria bacterium]|nr:hypothetical protein [Candidatus Poribacteria bacterium]